MATDNPVIIGSLTGTPDNPIFLGSLSGAGAGGVTDHGGLTGLGDDDHAQYALLAGRVGGQVGYGGNAANEDLTLSGTSHVTKTTSYVLLQPNGGNLGIGTTSPSALLSLGNGAGGAGTTAALGINFGDPTANLYRSSVGTISTDGGLTVGNGINVTANGVTAGFFQSNAEAQYLVLGGAGGTGKYYERGATSAAGFAFQAGSGQTGNILQWNNSSGTGLGAIDISGNLGIGTTSPPTVLTVVMNNGDSGVYFDQFADRTAVITRRANGTPDAPTATLAGNIMGGESASGHQGVGYTGVRARIAMFAAENWSATNQGTYIAFSNTAVGTTSIVERFRIGSSGQFGIGVGVDYGLIGKVITSAGIAALPTWSYPDSQYFTGTNWVDLTDGGATTLHSHAGGGMAIGGSITSATAGSVLFAGAAGVLAQDNASFFWDDGNNRLGLGIAVPLEQLHLTGNLRLPATTATVGRIMSGSNLLLHTFGANSVFLGIGAGNLTLTTANSNVGIGPLALSSLDNGTHNTAIGRSALLLLSGGVENVAVGYLALGNTNGDGSVAVGTQALQIGTGNRNIAIGLLALNRTTSGSNNVGLGYRTGYVNTTGTYNTYLGSYADAASNNLDQATAIGATAVVASSSYIMLGSSAESVGIAGAAKSTTGTGGLIFPDGTALTTMASNTAGFYANDAGGNVGMYSIAENGVLSQHIRMNAAHISHSITYISGTGTAGVDNTAQTVKTLVLPANTLTKINDRLRIRAYWTGDTGSPITGSVKLGPAASEVLTANTTDSGAATLQVNECFLHYIDNTRANIIENELGLVGGASGVNIAGFTWNAAQNIIFTQDAALGNRCILYALIVDILPAGIVYQ